MKVLLTCRNTSVNFFRLFSAISNNHPYDEVLSFQSNKQLANHLCSNILYDDNGIIVLNKPYGICFSRDTPLWMNEKQKRNANIIRHKVEEIKSTPKVSVEDDKINLHDAFPYIKSIINCSTLCLIKSPEKYTTGVCILGRNENIRRKVQHCWERSRAQKIPLESYLTICSGVPTKRYINNLRIAVGLDISENGKRKKAVLKQNYSRNDVLKSRVKVATVNSQLLSSCNDIASLVNIVTNQRKWHFIRLFLASHLLSPAIGDHLFGSRVKKVMGTTVAIDSWSNYAAQPQKLEPDLLRKLELLPGSEKFIPAMIHLSEVKLIQFLNKSEDLLISAPPPSYFTWTMDRLGLSLPSDSLSLKRRESSDQKRSVERSMN